MKHHCLGRNFVEVAFAITFFFASSGVGAVGWSEDDLRNANAAIERELDAALLRDFPALETYSEHERLAIFFALIAQDSELAKSLQVKEQPEKFAAYREGRIEISKADIATLQNLAESSLQKTSRELRNKLQELKKPIGLPLKFALEGVKALVALNAAFLSATWLASGGVNEISDTATALRTLTMISAIYLATLPVRIPTVLQRHHEKLESAKAARETAERTHQIPPAMHRLWFLTKELKRRLALAQSRGPTIQCSALFVPSVVEGS